MEVLVFANLNDSAKDRFFHEISKVPTLSPKFVLEHDLFLSLMMRNTIDWRVIVFFAYDQKHLAFSIKDYLIDTRVIMALSDWNAETVEETVKRGPVPISQFNRHRKTVISAMWLLYLRGFRPLPYNPLRLSQMKAGHFAFGPEEGAKPNRRLFGPGGRHRKK